MDFLVKKYVKKHFKNSGYIISPKMIDETNKLLEAVFEKAMVRAKAHERKTVQWFDI